MSNVYANGGIEFVGDHLNDVERCVVARILKLLDADLSVPFIARYRKQESGGLEAEKIRQIQQLRETYAKVQKKAAAVIKIIGDAATYDLKENLLHAKSIEEIEELYAPFKKGAKGTLADRARMLGLDDPAEIILKHPYRDIDIRRYLENNTNGAKSESDIHTGIQHIIAEKISKDKSIQDMLKDFIEPSYVHLTAKASPKAVELDKRKKFNLYYDFNSYVHRLQSFQILAINRGEQQKILSVKLEIHNRQKLLNFIYSLWMPPYNATAMNRKIISDAIEDSLKRLIEKKFLRRVRTKLTKKAELEAVDVFSRNLKHLLLVAPVKHKVILSIDPGFTNGCKIAVLDKNGYLLQTKVVNPFHPNTKEGARCCLIDMVKRHRVEIIGIGNGTACRETEKFVSEIIKSGAFYPFDVCYSIVNESGASIYSVTKEAKDEFGNLDPNLISAASIGRRLQDPLLEMVKIDAKHIGVGMYQHDIDETLLKAAEESVIEDCVSFIGIDLNAASVDMLKRVAGISKKQAESIVLHRNKMGEFVNREQLRTVKGIGKVTFQNCAGFVRIVRRLSNVKCEVKEEIKEEEKIEVKIEVKDEPGVRKRKARLAAGQGPENKKKKLVNEDFLPEPLDQTWIHPESYAIAHKVLYHLNATTGMIGSDQIKEMIRTFLCNEGQFLDLVCQLETDRETLKLILEGLQQPTDYDLRMNFEKPVFKTGLTSVNHLEVGQTVTGAVRNVTSFGIFIDIGVDTDGLMHTRSIPRGLEFGPGDRIECSINNIDIERGRISLSYRQKLSNSISLC